MRFFKMMGFVALILMGVTSAAVAQTHGKIDGCLASLYNYPSETLPHSASKKVSSPLEARGKLRVGEAGEGVHSQLGLRLQHHARE